MSTFTNKQLGLLVQEVGRQMLENDLSFEAVFDGSSKPDMQHELGLEIIRHDLGLSEGAEEDAMVLKLLTLNPYTLVETLLDMSPGSFAP